MESRAFCLSKSKRNMDAFDLIEDYSASWNVPTAQAVFRIVREYNQMKRWTIYNLERGEK